MWIIILRRIHVDDNEYDECVVRIDVTHDTPEKQKVCDAIRIMFPRWDIYNVYFSNFDEF